MTNEEEDLPIACLVDAGEEEDVASSEEAQRERIGRFAARVGVEVLDWCIDEDGGEPSRPAGPGAASGRRPLDVALVWQLSVLGFSPAGYRRHILPGAWTGPDGGPNQRGRCRWHFSGLLDAGPRQGAGRVLQGGGPGGEPAECLGLAAARVPDGQGCWPGPSAGPTI